MSRYKYEIPKGKLYKVSIADWNKTFNERGTWPLIVAEVYLQEDRATVQFVRTKFTLFLVLALYPLWFLLGVLRAGVKEACDDLHGVIFIKKHGRFSSDMIWKNRGGDSWSKLMRLLGEG